MNSKFPNRIRRWTPALSGLNSFLIYAALVLILHPTQPDRAFIPERSSLAAAVSNVIYRAPLGKVYEGVLERSFRTTSTEQFLMEAARKEIPLGALLSNTSDGNGIGYMTVANFAFRLFGTHIVSVVGAMLLLLGISAIAFLYRFPDRRSVVVVLHLTALTVMLFTPLVWLPFNVAQIPIGGIRYFSLLTILPAFHILFEIADRRGIETRMNAQIYVPLAVQVVVFLLALLVRNSAAPMIAALAVGGALYVWGIRREDAAKRWALRKAFFMVVVGAVFVGTLLASFSRGYLAEGRFTETVWHRIFVSLGLHPDFPYGDLRKIYDCTKYISEGLVSGPEDRNGHCVFLVDAVGRGITPEAAGGTYGRKYDAALRRATFHIGRLYPWEVLETFTLIKGRYIFWSIGESIKFDFNRIPAGLIGLLVAALANLLGFALFVKPAVAGEGGFAIGGALVLFAVFSLVPYILAWAMPHTSADLLCLCFMAVGLALTFVARRVRQALYPGTAGG